MNPAFQHAKEKDNLLFNLIENSLILILFIIAQ